MTDRIERPAIRYFGGKWRLGPWVISHFPTHQNYIEPCCGAASVLLQKDRSPIETINDLDGAIVNFFRVLRDRPDELVKKLKLTPWARAEYRLSYLPDPDPLEFARRFYMRSMMAISASHRFSSGTRMVKEVSGGIPAKYHTDCDHLYQIAERLMGVQIEQLPALECIERYDRPGALVYFDPPYVLETRTSGKEYTFEVDRQFHVEAAELLRRFSGYVVVSGYASELYTGLYEAHGWKRVELLTQTNGDKKIESLWLSPRTVEALAREAIPNPQIGLFEAAR